MIDCTLNALNCAFEKSDQYNYVDVDEYANPPPSPSEYNRIYPKSSYNKRTPIPEPYSREKAFAMADEAVVPEKVSEKPIDTTTTGRKTKYLIIKQGKLENNKFYHFNLSIPYDEPCIPGPQFSNCHCENGQDWI